MNLNENNPFNSSADKFGLPEGYFQKSAGSIINKLEWEEEHKDFPTLYALKNKGGFIVPDSYFSKAERQLEFLMYPALKTARNTQIFKSPDAYFEEAEIRELSGVLVESENELSGFEKLSTLPKLNVFKVPANYFNGNEEKLGKLVVKIKSASVIHLFKKQIAFAAAAVMLVALGLWVYSAFMKTDNTQLDCGTIACVDRMDVIESKSIDNLEDEDLYELVNPGDLEKRLDGTKDTKNKSDKKADSSLKNISTDALLDEI